MGITNTVINRAGRSKGYSRSAVNSVATSAGSGLIMIADPGAGYKIAIEHLTINCAADESVSIRQDSTVVLGPIIFKVAGPIFWSHQFMKEDGEGSLLLLANKELQVFTVGTSAVQLYCEYHILKEA